MNDFQAAIPFPIKWAVNPNKFDENGKNPVQLALFIPTESVVAFAQYLMDMADDQSKARTGKVWDYNNNQEKEITGFYLNAKGKIGNEGTFGNINPAKVKTSSEPAF
jgi:hypothetical protein